MTSIEFNFDPVATTRNPSFSSFFINQVPVDCPVTSCSLMAAGNFCQDVSSTPGYVLADLTSPWGITMNVAVEDGYVDLRCYTCTNGA